MGKTFAGVGVLAFLLFIVFMSVLLMGPWADRALLTATTAPMDARGAEQRLIPYGHGRAVEVFVARSPGMRDREPEAFVLEFPGQGDRAERFVADSALAWGDRPVEVWVMNYPGIGASTGPARLTRVPSAALAAFDALRRRASGRPVFLRANSFGTTVALHVASQRTVDGLILQSPPALRSLIVAKHGGWNGGVIAGAVAMQVPRQFNSVSNGSRVTAPAVFVITEGDTYVDPPFQRKVVDAYAGEKRIVSLPVNHNPVYGAAETRAVDAAMTWLWHRPRSGSPQR